jgi:GH35 family endo-1,4-beta-xylanase
MKNKLKTIALATCLISALSLIADIPKPISVLATTESLQNGYFSGNKAEGNWFQALPAEESVQYNIDTVGDVPWSITAGAPNMPKLEKGTLLFVAFKARAVRTYDESGEGEIGVIFERTGTPYNKSLRTTVTVGEEWLQIYESFLVDDNYAKEGSAFVFHLGAKRQIIEIKDFSLVELPADTDQATLPSTSREYEGIALDAPWRAEAEKRIKENRMADIDISIKDAEGKPIPGAKIKVEMTKHAFPFGTCVASGLYANPNSTRCSKEKRDKYREIVNTKFNSVSPENAFKWMDWIILEDYLQWGIKATKEWNERGISVRGHVLVWPSWKKSPALLKEYKNRPEELKAMIGEHVTRYAKMFNGKVRCWDVINEPMDNHDFMNVLGNDIMIEWFQLAQAEDPNATLLLNDYGLLSGGSHMTHFQKTVQNLIDGGAPIEGIGTQCHFGSSVTPPKKLLERLDKLSKFGLPIEVTEFDIDSDDEGLQSDYMRDFLTATFSHPSIAGIQMWGFWTKAHWKPQAALWDDDFNIRPHGQMYLDLVYGTWWTNETGVTNKEGNFDCRGFLGNYNVTVETAGKKITKEFKLSKDKDTWTVSL